MIPRRKVLGPIREYPSHLWTRRKLINCLFSDAQSPYTGLEPNWPIDRDWLD